MVMANYNIINTKSIQRIALPRYLPLTNMSDAGSFKTKLVINLPQQGSKTVHVHLNLKVLQYKDRDRNGVTV